jgi:hypothetical protein
MLTQCSEFHQQCRDFDRDLEEFLRHLTTEPSPKKRPSLLVELQAEDDVPTPARRTKRSDSAADMCSQTPPPDTAARHSAIQHALFLQQQLVLSTTAEARSCTPPPVQSVNASDSPLQVEPAAVGTSPEIHADVSAPSEPAPSAAPLSFPTTNAIDATPPQTNWDVEAQKALASGEWKSAIDPRGRTYFMNKRERVTVWNLAKELRRRSGRS